MSDALTKPRSSPDSRAEAASATAAPAGPPAVSRFEAALLRMLRGFVRGEAPAVAAGRLTMPAGLSAECLQLVRDTLGKGCVTYLARAGGWRKERYLRAGQPVEGRLWERTPVSRLALDFSRHSISLLMWLTAGRPEKQNNWDPPVEELTAADQFLLFLAYEGSRRHEANVSLRARPQVQRHGLIRLAFPEDFIGVTAEIDGAFWVEGVGAALTEALQPKLQERWLNIERGKHLIADWTKLRGLGLSQEQSLSAYLSACEAAKRPDLARFLLRALAEVLSSDLTPAFWNGGLQSAAAPPRLADRLETQRQGLAALRQLERLAGWARNYAGTKFFDDDYHVAQLWLVDWEQYRGEEIAGLAQNLLRQLEPLRLSAPAAASGTENAAVNGAPTKRGE